jgi:hypothetical protein
MNIMLTNEVYGGSYMNNMYPVNTMPMAQQNNIPCMPMPRLATAYVPFQYLNSVYPPMQGLERGTIFPELDRPYGVDPEYTVDA